VERDAGKKVAAAFKGVKAAIHRNHGLLTASRHSIESAAFWFIDVGGKDGGEMALHAGPPATLPAGRL
jgi:hypothetical protein